MILGARPVDEGILTFKRSSTTSIVDPKQQQQEPDTAQPSPDMNTATSSTDKFPCLARLQTKRAKASTLIAPDQTAAFMRAYTDIVRGTVASTLRAAGDAARGAGKKKRKKGKSAAGGQLSPKQ